MSSRTDYENQKDVDITRRDNLAKAMTNNVSLLDIVDFLQEIKTRYDLEEMVSKTVRFNINIG